jgi:hypothetical protein
MPAWGPQSVQPQAQRAGICTANTKNPNSGPTNKGEEMPIDSRLKLKKEP